MRKTSVAVILGFMSVMAFAAVPMVTDVTAKQRYPWNGLVDITCNVSGIEGATNGLTFAVAAVLPDSGKARKVRNFWVVQGGTNSTDREVHVNGDYHLIWDAEANLGIVDYSNMVVRVTLDAHDKVQLWEGGPYWATTNIGAEKPEDYGYYFWWGDTIGYEWENNRWVASDCSNSNSLIGSIHAPTYYKSISTLQSDGWIVTKDGIYVLAPEHDAAHIHWGGNWRMPTVQELSDLNSRCDWTWTTQNGVNGYIVSGRGKYVSNSIFLPCAGAGWDTSLEYSGSNGSYWSSEPDWYDLCAYELWFYSAGHGTSEETLGTARLEGLSVRPVQGFTK